jgi:hypothetical protein
MDTLELLILDSDGYLSKGCGVVIGNVKRAPVAAISRSFDARRHPVLSTLLRDGPLGLAREAAEFGYALKRDYPRPLPPVPGSAPGAAPQVPGVPPAGPTL